MIGEWWPWATHDELMNVYESEVTGLLHTSRHFVKQVPILNCNTLEPPCSADSPDVWQSMATPGQLPAAMPISWEVRISPPPSLEVGFPSLPRNNVAASQPPGNKSTAWQQVSRPATSCSTGKQRQIHPSPQLMRGPSDQRGGRCHSSAVPASLHQLPQIALVTAQAGRGPKGEHLCKMQQPI